MTSTREGVMKRFMFFSAGVLCLAVAVLIGFHIGSQEVQALPEANTALDPSGIVAIFDGSNNNSVQMLDEHGQVWHSDRFNISSPVCWRLEPSFAVPVPVGQIKHWSLYFFVTDDDHLWVLTYGWTDCGPWPDVPVSTQPATFSDLKSQYKPKEIKK